MVENFSYDKEILNNIKETINPDNRIRKNAENYLTNLKNKDLTSFIKQLLIIFQEKSIPIIIRETTSLLIKNILKLISYFKKFKIIILLKIIHFSGLDMV